MKAATIYDVARLAGVSHQTVSRFLSGFEGIRPETKARVEAAVVELQYRPNTAARSLRLQRRTRIGLIVDRLDESGPARVIAGATRAAQSSGYLMDVVPTEWLDDEASLESALGVLLDSQVAGVLAIAETTAATRLVDRLLTDVPVVDSQRLLAQRVGPFNQLAGEAAADHLLDLGHRRLAYLAGPESWIAATERLAGFAARLDRRGGALLRVDYGDWSAASGHAAWGELALAAHGVTAIACGNDSMAVGLIAAAAEAGVRVPEDLSVIGTDDIREAAYLRPSLSTVAVDFEGQGAAFVAALLGALGESEHGIAPPRPPRAIQRHSTRELPTPG